MREQFTFYRSFWAAVKTLKKASDRLSIMEAVCAYALDGEDRKMTDAAEALFILIKPNLDSAAKKSKGGKNKERAGEDSGKTCASSGEDSGKEKEKEKEVEKEVEIENECYLAPPPGAGAGVADPELGAVMALYLDRINPSPSCAVVDQLKADTAELGGAVVCHAINIALDERKTSWSYISAILRRYRQQGLTTMDRVLESEQRHQRAKQTPQGYGAAAPVTAETEAESFERMRRMAEAMKERPGRC